MLAEEQKTVGIFFFFNPDKQDTYTRKAFLS